MPGPPIIPPPGMGMGEVMGGGGLVRNSGLVSSSRNFFMGARSAKTSVLLSRK